MWSPDGTKIAFYATPEGRGDQDLFVVPSTGGQPERLLDRPGFQYPEAGRRTASFLPTRRRQAGLRDATFGCCRQGTRRGPFWQRRLVSAPHPFPQTDDRSHSSATNPVETMFMSCRFPDQDQRFPFRPMAELNPPGRETERSSSTGKESG